MTKRSFIVDDDDDGDGDVDDSIMANDVLLMKNYSHIEMNVDDDDGDDDDDHLILYRKKSDYF